MKPDQIESEFLVRNSLFDYTQHLDSLIINEPSEKLFNFDELTLFCLVESIRPDAQFMFENVKHLRLDIDHISKSTVQEMAHTIDQFKRLSKSIQSLELICDEKRDKYAIYFMSEKRLDDFDLIKESVSSVSKFCLQGGKLKNLDPAVFNQSLVDLELSYITVMNMNTQKSLFSNLINLRSLNLSGAQFLTSDLFSTAHFDAEFTTGLESLTRLNLNESHFNSFKREAFDKLANLESLDLSDVELGSIERFAFESLTKLTQLNFSKNEIKKLDKETFKGLISLEKLDLSYNKFRDIEPGTFENLSSLKQLDLSWTCLRAIKANTFQGLSKLEDLKLCFCEKLSELEPGAFLGLQNLMKLNLSCSESLEKIQSKVFDGLTQLRELNLSKCSIESIHPSAFNDLPNVEVVNLNSNAFVKLVMACTPRILDLSENHFLEMASFSGSDLWRLEELNLRENYRLLVDFNAMFNNYKDLRIQRVFLPFHLFYFGTIFTNMKKIKNVQIMKSNSNADNLLMSNAFSGLADLERLEIMFDERNEMLTNLFWPPPQAVLEITRPKRPAKRRSNFKFITNSCSIFIKLILFNRK